jgi:hypothetical protein
MNGLSTADWIILGVAAYKAVLSLVRLMIAHGTTVAHQLATQVEHERQQKAAAERLAKKEAAKKEKEAVKKEAA